MNHADQCEKKINNDPVFRTKFSKVCNLLGIDPIVVKKQMFGSYQDFYTRLGVKILKICEKYK